MFRQVQVNDYAKYLGVMIGPGAATHRWTDPGTTLLACVPAVVRPRRALFKDFSFDIHALSVLTFVGSMAEPDKETISVETAALQRLWAGPLYALPSAMFRRGSTCGLKIDVDGVQLTSKAARFRVASRSCCRLEWRAFVARKIVVVEPLIPSSLSWEDRYFNTSVAYHTTTAFQEVNRMDGLHSLRDVPFHKTQSGAATMLRESGNILDTAKSHLQSLKSYYRFC